MEFLLKFGWDESALLLESDAVFAPILRVGWRPNASYLAVPALTCSNIPLAFDPQSHVTGKTSSDRRRERKQRELTAGHRGSGVSKFVLLLFAGLCRWRVALK